MKYNTTYIHNLIGNNDCISQLSINIVLGMLFIMSEALPFMKNNDFNGVVQLIQQIIFIYLD